MITPPLALSDRQKLIVVATYQSTTLLPEPLKHQLPAIEKLEERLQAIHDEDIQA